MNKFKIAPQKISWALLLFMILGYVISVVNKSREVSSLFFVGAFGMTCICAILCFFFLSSLKREDPFWLCLFIVALASINVLMGSGMHSGSDYFAKVMRFDATVMMIYMCTKYIVGESVIRIYRVINQVLILVLAYQGLVVKETYYTYTTMTLGFPNPNHGGIWTFLCFGGVMWSFSASKSRIKKIFYIGEMCLLFVLLRRTACRSALIGMCGFILLTLYGFIKVKLTGIENFNGKLYRYITAMSCLFPFIFPIIYLSIYFSGSAIGSIAGQSFFSGREILWYNALSKLDNHFIIGIYNEISLGTGQSQMHNIYIDVLCSYGIVVFACFLFYIFCITLKQMRKVHSISQYIAFMAFLMLFFVAGTYEAAYVSGDHGINYWTCLYLLLSNTDKT